MVFASLIVTVWLALCAPAPAAREAALPPVYDHWLHAEVNYLITDDERNLFLHLKTNEERDKFIDTFWKFRNPDPQAPTNLAKETHYQRLAYANAHYSRGSSQDGWASDQGMVYITLGAPQQIQRYVETGELKPIQIWFYQNLSGALPVHFYVVFYRRSAAEEYELYSPYGDRPQKLINSTNAINDDKAAIKIIQHDTSDEVAHIVLSLIPGEPVDFKDPTPTLQSDVLLNNIRNYRNLPQTRELLAARRAADESVSHRVILGEQSSDLSAIATRGGAHRAGIDYLLRLLRPDDFALAEQAGGRYYYSIEVQTRLVTAAGEVVFDRRQPMTDYVSAKSFEGLQGKCFGVAGRLEAAPGRYQLTVSLTNLTNKQVFRQTRAVVVPGEGDRLGVSQVFFAAAAAPGRAASVDDPFSFAGARFAPIGSDHATVAQGAPLRAIFQLWAAPGSPNALRSKTLGIHYLIGRLDNSGRVEEDQQVDRGGFTPDGNLLLGRDLRTDALSPGAYRLVVKVTDPETVATAYQSLNFEVVDRDHPGPGLWTLDVPNSNK